MCRKSLRNAATCISVFPLHNSLNILTQGEHISSCVLQCPINLTDFSIESDFNILDIVLARMDSDDLVIIESETTSMAPTPSSDHSHPSPAIHHLPTLQKSEEDLSKGPTPTCDIQDGCECYGCRVFSKDRKHSQHQSPDSFGCNPFESEQISSQPSREPQKPSRRYPPCVVLPHRSKADRSRHPCVAPMPPPPPPPLVRSCK
jgi:hypothetical protein